MSGYDYEPLSPGRPRLMTVRYYVVSFMRDILAKERRLAGLVQIAGGERQDGFGGGGFGGRETMTIEF